MHNRFLDRTASLGIAIATSDGNAHRQCLVFVHIRFLDRTVSLGMAIATLIKQKRATPANAA